MMKKIISILSLVLVISSSSAVNIYAQNKYDRDIIIGRNEEISADLNKKEFKEAKEVFLINKNSIVDSISATPLAYAKNAPIIVGDWMELPRATKRYLKDLEVEKVTIVGGLASISRTLENELRESGLEVTRISGTDRIQTSTRIANEMKKIKDFSEIFIMSSSTGLENALSIYSYAAQKNIPIIWADDTKLEKTIKYVKKQNVDKIYAVGDSERFISELESGLDNVKSIKGINKFDTNINFIEELYNEKDLEKLYTVKVDFGSKSNANQYISLGVVAAKENIPILVCGENLTYMQNKFLKENNVKEIIQVGEKIGDYSIMQTLLSDNFISASIMILLLLVITIRAFKVKI